MRLVGLGYEKDDGQNVFRSITDFDSPLASDNRFTIQKVFFPIDRALSFMLDLTISKKADETSHINHRFLTLKIPDCDNAIRKKK